MSDAPKDKDQEKGDEVLRRLLKTPPDHKTGKRAVNRPLTKKSAEDKPSDTSGKTRRSERS